MCARKINARKIFLLVSSLCGGTLPCADAPRPHILTDANKFAHFDKTAGKFAIIPPDEPDRRVKARRLRRSDFPRDE